MEPSLTRPPRPRPRREEALPSASPLGTRPAAQPSPAGRRGLEGGDLTAQPHPEGQLSPRRWGHGGCTHRGAFTGPGVGAAATTEACAGQGSVQGTESEPWRPRAQAEPQAQQWDSEPKAHTGTSARAHTSRRRPTCTHTCTDKAHSARSHTHTCTDRHKCMHTRVQTRPIARAHTHV